MEGRQFDSLHEIEMLVRDFEACSIPYAEWNHRAHLAVSAWYLCKFPEAEATERMIKGIRRYNYAHGIVSRPGGGYHETITLFWLAISRAYLRSMERHRLLSKVNACLRRFEGHKNLPLEFYDRERLFSDEARCHWVPPDRYPEGELSDLSEALAAAAAPASPRVSDASRLRTLRLL